MRKTFGIICLLTLMAMSSAVAQAAEPLAVSKVSGTECIVDYDNVETKSGDEENTYTTLSVRYEENTAHFKIENLERGCEWEGMEIRAEKEGNSITVYLEVSVNGIVPAGICRFSPEFDVENIAPGEYDLKIMSSYTCRTDVDSEPETSITEDYSRKIYLEDGETFTDMLTMPVGYEYVPLVREGVIWTYVFADRMVYREEYFHLTFNGEETFNGKTYKIWWKWQGDCGFDPQTALQIGYMREENGRIYTYVPDENEEYKFYDLNFLKVGYENFGLTFEGYEKIGDVYRKKYAVETDDDYGLWKGAKFIEGIGMIGEDTGYLPYPLFPVPADGSMPPRLTLQTTMDGEVIYDAGGNELNPCVHGYEYKPMVREGVEWVYYMQDKGFVRLTLSGEAEIDGVVYKKCWQYSDCEFSEDAAEVVAYMREDDKKVYARYPEQTTSYTEEYCLYDFNMGKGNYYDNPFADEDVYRKDQESYYQYGTSLQQVYALLGTGDSFGSYYYLYETIGFELYLLPFPFKESAYLLYVSEQNEIRWDSYWKSEHEDPCLNQGAVEFIVSENSAISMFYECEQIKAAVSGEQLSVGVYTLDGVKMLDGEGDGEVVLSTVELPIGIYIVKAMTETAEKTMKIVVK